MKKTWLVFIGLGIILSSLIVYKLMSIKNRNYDLSLEKEYAGMYNFHYNDLAKISVKNDEDKDAGQRIASIFMVKIDMEKTKTRVMECLASNEPDDYQKCEEIFVKKIYGEVEKRGHESASVQDMDIASTMFREPLNVFPYLKRDFYKSDDIVSIIAIALTRMNLPQEFDSIKKCMVDNSIEDTQHFNDCFEGFRKKYETNIQEIISDSYFKPDPKIANNTKKAMNEIRFTRIHKDAISSLMRAYIEHGMTEKQAKYKTAFILSRLDLLKMREETLKCFENNQNLPDENLDEQNSHKNCGTDYILKIMDSANVQIEGEEDFMESYFAYTLEMFLEDKQNDLVKNGYSERDAAIISVNVHSQLDIRKCVKQGMICFGNSENKKTVGDCLSPCLEEAQTLTNQFTKKYGFKPNL